MPFVQIGAGRHGLCVRTDIRAIPPGRPGENTWRRGICPETRQRTEKVRRMPEHVLPASRPQRVSPRVRDASAEIDVVDVGKGREIPAPLAEQAHPAARRPAVEINEVHAVREGDLLHGVADHLLPHARRHLVRDEADLRLRAVVVRAPLSVRACLAHVVPARHLVARRAVGRHESIALRGVQPQRRALEAGRLLKAGVRARHDVQRALQHAYGNLVARLHGVRRERERVRAGLLDRRRLWRREDAVGGHVAVRRDNAQTLVVVNHELVGRCPHEAARRKDKGEFDFHARSLAFLFPSRQTESPTSHVLKL